VNYLILRKAAGALFLVSALFLIMGWVAAFLDSSATIGADFIILNGLCVILMVAAGILTLMLNYRIPILGILGIYILLSVDSKEAYSLNSFIKECAIEIPFIPIA